jgi:hypothetical protein
MSASPKRVDILITGSGSLATSVLQALSLVSGPCLTITVVGRDSSKLTWLARSMTARAATMGGRLRVRIRTIDWNSPVDLRSILKEENPRLVLHTASMQSPWQLGGNEPWAVLIRRTGYGFTLPLQLALALKVGEALADVAPETLFVNACYPDVVNPMLSAIGISVICGIGNIAILAGLMSVELVAPPGRLRVLAHHSHLSSSISGNATNLPIRAWRGSQAIDEEARSWLASATLPADDRLNTITGATAVPALLALLGLSSPHRGHAPGVLGLPGGYPVVFSPGKVHLDLPSGVYLSEATRFNARATLDDGLVLSEGGSVRLSESAARQAFLTSADIDSKLLQAYSATDCPTHAGLLTQLRGLLGGR